LISAAFWHRPSLPGVTGTPAAAATLLAEALSPMRAITEEVGPRNFMLHASQISAKRAFSARKP
jgi:hypothetical protein